ncbi:MAG: hypothetical protein JXX29_10770 [Deltaproteobacteria bacterium]|nr:hypothetical protein [Deltaproteobacteria bacterium]MBN2672151.1 hypothetical protein [Deltaproteobacteria bacterium]
MKTRVGGTFKTYERVRQTAGNARVENAECPLCSVKWTVNCISNFRLIPAPEKKRIGKNTVLRFCNVGVNRYEIELSLKKVIALTFWARSGVASRPPLF